MTSITEMFGHEIKLVRAMPNTPALVGEAMSAVTPNNHVDEEEIQEVMAILKALEKQRLCRKL